MGHLRSTETEGPGSGTLGVKSLRRDETDPRGNGVVSDV